MRSLAIKHTSSIRPILFVCLLAIVNILFSSCSTAQPVTVSIEEIKGAIRDNRWVFIAERSDPPIGRSTQISLGYEVRCSGDTAVFNLPYSGTMQGPARFPDGKGPLDFTSLKFTINKVEKSPGKWLVSLKPRDVSDVLSANFTFFENGKASLDVILSNRTPMDFFGRVEPLK